MPKRSRDANRSQDPHIVGRNQKHEEIPDEFFCPISKKFMSDPVRIPNHDITYDRESVQHLHLPEDVRPDLRMRITMADWFSRYDLSPVFQFISNQDELAVAVGSVLEQRRRSLLRKLARVIRQRPWLMKNGQCIWCVATLLSRPHPSAQWVKATLSIVADVSDDIELVVPSTGIDPEYSLLDPIINILDSQLCEKDEFKLGFVKLMHCLVVNSPGIIPMSRKLQEIIKVLVSYLWPVPSDFMVGWYQKLLITLERLSENQENCQRMVDLRVVGLSLTPFILGVSSMDDIRNNGDYVSASLTFETIVKLFDKLCQHSQKAREEIIDFFVSEVNVFCTVLFNHVKSTEASVAGSRVLAHITSLSGNGFNIDINDFNIDMDVNPS